MTTEERLEKLERELASVKRRNRWLVGIVALAVMAWASARIIPAAQAQGAGTAAKEIRANKFILADENGKPQGALFVSDDGGGMLGLGGGNGKYQVMLSANGKQAHLGLSDENGKPRAALALNEDGASLVMTDENGKPRALLNGGENSVLMSLSDEKGIVRFGVTVNKYGPRLSLLGESGKSRAALQIDPTGPSLDLYDEKGNTRAKLGVAETVRPDGRTISSPESSLLLFGPDGKLIWQAPR